MPAVRSLDNETHRINLAWLLKLRWGAIAGQLVTILIASRVLGVALPSPILLGIISLEAVSNLGIALWLRRRPFVREGVLTALMAADVLLLTALLYETGGVYNPFNFLYLVHIALATVVLTTRAAWGLVALAFVGFGVLFLEPASRSGHPHHVHAGAMQMHMHMQGMWVAFGVAAAFIVYFVTRVTRDLQHREHELGEARARAARAEKLSSLATLAAGAAHELATPLATIAVVARELERDLECGARAEEKSGDARMIRDVVVRCQAILARMAVDAGQTAGEGFSALSISELLDAALAERAPGVEVRVTLDAPARSCRLLLPPHAVTRALADVLDNACQAVEQGGAVELRAEVAGEHCMIEVKDSGVGMTPEVLARAGEPFFTTKDPGGGMGLGLFVTRSVLEGLGGRLELRSVEGRGTSVLMTLPLAAPRDNSPQPDLTPSLLT